MLIQTCLVFQPKGLWPLRQAPDSTLSHRTASPASLWSHLGLQPTLWATPAPEGQGLKGALAVREASGPAQPSPKMPGSLFTCGSSLVFFGCLLFRGRAARGARMELGLALKVTMKGCLARAACRPSRPARPGSTLCPERDGTRVTHGGFPVTDTQQGLLCSEELQAEDLGDR